MTQRSYTPIDMFKKPTFVLTFLMTCLTFGVTAQIEHGGSPFNWHEKSYDRAAIDTYSTGALDLELLRNQDEVTDQYKEAPYRFGEEWKVSLDRNEVGNTIELENGASLWQLAIECPEATSISFIFNRFKLADGAKLFIWNEDRSAFKGSYTSESNQPHGGFGVGLIDGDLAVIELYEPADVAGKSILEVGTIVHGYRSMVGYGAETNRGPFGNSGACNINVNCPEGDMWQTESRSVALIVSGGFAVCSGALVNNTAQDGTPYFLTANHCLGGNNNWVFYFNHETAGCNGSNGPTNQSVSGSSLLASSAGSDMALLELNETPPADFNVQYAGWDNSDQQTVQNTTGIHHPSGDVKKICFDEDNPYHANQAGAAVWYIDEWEDGVTEGGSSGSPLFDQNHRIIGQLYGGFAACNGSVNNGGADWYGRFGVSWDGNSPSSRLRDWLDPLNTGATVLDGYPEGFEALAYDVVAGAITGVDEVVCGNTAFPSVVISNMGTTTVNSITIEYYVNGTLIQTIPWTGTLEQFASTTVALPAANLQDGNNEITVVLEGPNAENDENNTNNSATFEFTANTGPTLDYVLELTLDDYGSETTWEVRNANNQVVYNGGPYADDADGELVTVNLCIEEGCYTFTIFDAFGDGICCGWGEGSYELYNHLGQTFATGGEFTDEDNVDFCTQDLSIGSLEASELKIYPNPANQNAIIELPVGADRLEVLNAVGQIVHSQSVVNDNQVQLNTADLPTGWYFVRAEGDNAKMTGQLLIRH